MYIFNMSNPNENNFQEVILSDDENTQIQHQNNEVRSSGLEMRTIYSNDNLILDTQISSDVLSDYGGSMYSPQFRNNLPTNSNKKSSKLQYICIFMNHVMSNSTIIDIGASIVLLLYCIYGKGLIL